LWPPETVVTRTLLFLGFEEGPDKGRNIPDSKAKIPGNPQM
jgi:hypothetical protein